MRKKVRVSLLGAAGALLLLAGLCGLYSGPEISQYAFAPENQDTGKILEQAEKELDGAFPAVSLHGSRGDLTLETEKRKQGGITLYQIRGDWQSVYTQAFTAGRPLSRGDYGHAVIVLDAETAFQLFGDEDPLGQRVKIGGKAFETVGVAKHARRIGETDPRAAWIPMGVEGAPENEILVLSAGGKSGAALRTVFETVARNAVGDGQAFHLGKERSRGTILPRAVALIFGIRLLAAWIRRCGRKSRKWIAEIRARSKVRYPRQMAGYFLLRAGGITLLYAGAVALGAGLAVMAVQPMTVFPEWVPEILVDPESVAKRFWDLTSAAARPRKWRTPEIAEIRFWSGAVRWGTVILLAGLWKKKEKTDQTESLPSRGEM